MASVGNLENPDGFPGSSSSARSRVGVGGVHLPRPHLTRPHLTRPRLVPTHLPRPHLPRPNPARPAVGLDDVADRLLRAGRSAARPVVDLGLHPPLVPEPLHPARLVDRVGELGAPRRESLQHWAASVLDVLVPATVEAVLRRLDLTQVVLRHIDLDAVVAAVDLDAAAARLDVDAVVAGVDLDPILERVDVNAVAARVDIDAVLDRLDLTELVRQRVDLDAVVAGVDLDPITERVDVDAIASRIDVDAVASRIDVDAVLDRLDLTSVVLQRVDLDALVDAVLARIDLVGLAEAVIEGVDLPEIIRESTGSMASDTVRGARVQGIHADEAVGRAMDRMLLRRSARHPSGPQLPAQEPTRPPHASDAEESPQAGPPDTADR